MYQFRLALTPSSVLQYCLQHQILAAAQETLQSARNCLKVSTYYLWLTNLDHTFVEGSTGGDWTKRQSP